MDSYPPVMGLIGPQIFAWHGVPNGLVEKQRRAEPPTPALAPAADVLRRVAWDVGERKALDRFVPAGNHIGLAMVSPYQGYAHWHMLPGWVDEIARQKGDAWHQCRMVLRLYDVSYITFNGFNAHRIQDESIGHLAGHRFFNVQRPGTWQLAEVGFVLRNGEFIPASRSNVVRFSPDAWSGHGDHAALLVDDRGRREEIGNLWEQEKVLQERRKPKPRAPLRIATFALAARETGQQGMLAQFVSELAAGQGSLGHQVHVFVPAEGDFTNSREVNGVHFEPLAVEREGSALDVALSYARAAEERLRDLPPFDLFHLHEWTTGMAPWIGTRPTVLSLSSIEATRRNGAMPSPLSQEIQQAERSLAHSVDCILTPEWLKDQAIAEFGIDGNQVHAFPMEAHLPTEWEQPLDYGQIKKDIHFGPLDRLLLFIGPLEHAAGVDLLVDALPTMLGRASNVRVAFVGQGNMHGHLQHRAHQLGVSHAVRLLGHVEGPFLTKLVRSAEALVLPSRYRVPFDDAVVDLARRAGRPVVTTHGGPAHVVKHEETGLVTYDNPGSMVWAMDRILGDPGHAQRMGQNGRHSQTTTISWEEVARRYLDLCAACFPELRAND